MIITRFAWYVGRLSRVAAADEVCIRAMQADAVAKTAVHSRVGLDIEAGGNAFIRDIHGAREVVGEGQGRPRRHHRRPASGHGKRSGKIAGALVGPNSAPVSNTDQTAAGLRIDATAGGNATVTVNQNQGADLDQIQSAMLSVLKTAGLTTGLVYIQEVVVPAHEQ
ncbi:hypothetical protein ABIC09_003182 [Bradyrhizobium sp. S3.12.5]|uniref:hypothetical protein n=1 Tax=Bradyrhizobium sp. S3.12.5 TaxID=3156386 RepID=UPI00339A93F7